MILITQPRVGTSHNEILALQVAARQLGWDVLSAPSGWRLDKELIDSGVKGVAYGSQTFCEVIAQQMGWLLKQNSFDWLAKVPSQYLSREVDFMTLGQAEKLTERKFIKPADDKCFDAKIYEPGEFKPHELISRNYPVLVSDVVEFDLEYRCFVNDFKVATWSNYIYNEHIADPKFWHKIPEEEKTDPAGFVQTLLNITNWLYTDSDLDTVASVIDIGRIPGKGWAIIETNPAWASGLYGCDPIEALKIMGQACV